MEDEVTTAIWLRIAALERSRRRTRRLVAASFALGVLVGLTGNALAGRKAVEGNLRAESFVLVDSSGKERGALMVQEGTATLRLRDANGQVTVELGGRGRAFPVHP